MDFLSIQATLANKKTIAIAMVSLLAGEQGASHLAPRAQSVKRNGGNIFHAPLAARFIIHYSLAFATFLMKDE